MIKIFTLSFFVSILFADQGIAMEHSTYCRVAPQTAFNLEQLSNTLNIQLSQDFEMYDFFSSLGPIKVQQNENGFTTHGLPIHPELNGFTAGLLHSNCSLTDCYKTKTRIQLKNSFTFDGTQFKSVNAYWPEQGLLKLSIYQKRTWPPLLLKKFAEVTYTCK